MFIYVQDWTKGTNVLGRLDRRGVSHEGVAYKIVGNPQDPRHLFCKPTLKVFETREDPFGSNEFFCYRQRGEITGFQLESYLREIGLTPLGNQLVRSYLRFAHTLGIDQEAMRVKLENGRWILDNPIQAVDGIEKSLTTHQPNPEEHLHLDVYRGPVLRKLENYYKNSGSDLKDPSQILSLKEYKQFRRSGERL